jgi:SOS-response transcriptional repressor LexA
MPTPISTTPLRLLGAIDAGFPSPAEEELSDTMTLDEYLMKNREATFTLKASNDAMIGAGILAGDLVLVERGRTPHAGDIVIAEVDGAWMLRYFRKRGSRVYLEAANGKYKPVVPMEKLMVAAVVVAVVRKY